MCKCKLCLLFRTLDINPEQTSACLTYVKGMCKMQYYQGPINRDNIERGCTFKN